MAKVYELSTKNGRTFRVVVENDSQEKRLLRRYNESKSKDSYEALISCKVIINGIHNIKEFENLLDTLQ